MCQFLLYRKISQSYDWLIFLYTKDSLSRIRLFATPWTVIHQIPLSMGFSRQEYWSGVPFPSPGDLPGPGIEPRSPALQEDALTSEPPGKWDPKTYFLFSKIHLNQILSNQVHSMYLWPESYLFVKKKLTAKEKHNCERLGDIPNKASKFSPAMRIHLYLLIKANVSVTFLKGC